DDDGSVVMFSLKGPQSMTAISGAFPNPDVIVVSPTGSAIATYSSASRTIQVIRSLPQTPEVTQEFGLSATPGDVRNMALSDDGLIALVNINNEDRTQLWIVDSSGPRLLGSEGATRPVFFPNRHDALIADDVTQTSDLVMNVEF